MASISGVISVNGQINGEATQQVARMLKLMRHRGADNTHIRTVEGFRGAVGAGEVNLSPDKTACASLKKMPYILFDGEIYNERPDGQTDIELFRAAYKELGRESFGMLNGSFTCAVVDDDEVILARDHVGARPVFYGLNNGNGSFYFSTEMKGLSDHVKFDVHELPPGHIYSTKSGLEPFEAVAPELPDLGDIKETAAILRELMIEAVRIRMNSVGGVSLSGGLDSSIVAAIAKKYNPDLKLFTGTIDKAPGPDLENAKLMADFLGLEHHIYRITDEDIDRFFPDAIWYLESFDEDCINGIISNYYVSQMAKDFTNCILVGEGADELFGGYRMVLKNPKVKDDQEREELARKLLEISYNTALRRLDRSWMANGVVYRTPFLDPKVVAFAEKIPMKWKIYGEKQVEKFILREAFRDMLPEKIANREKLRFSMGVGMDDVMDEIISQKMDPEEYKERPKAAYGLPFASFKELYYYDEFLRRFPPSYEKQTVRWDPFK